MTEKHFAWLWIAVLAVFVLAAASTRWRPNDTRPTLTAVQYIDALNALAAR